MAKVLKPFKCKVTKKIFRKGATYSGERAEELEELGYVEIDEEDKAWPKHIGKGVYQLSNGEKVKGKTNAITAQEEIGDK
jgi:hypothetical protein